MPFRERRDAGEGLGYRGAHLAWEEAGCEGPDGLHVRDCGAAGADVVRVGHGEAVAEVFELAADQDLRSDGERLGPRWLGAAGFEEDEFGEAGAVGDGDAPGLAAVFGLVVADHVHREGCDLAWLGLADGGAAAAVDVAFGEVEQQVEHPLAARGAG